MTKRKLQIDLAMASGLANICGPSGTQQTYLLNGKIQVFNLIVRSRSLYIYECLLATSEINKGNGFQSKMLRKILGRPSTILVDEAETTVKIHEDIERDH